MKTLYHLQVPYWYLEKFSNNEAAIIAAIEFFSGQKSSKNKGSKVTLDFLVKNTPLSKCTLRKALKRLIDFDVIKKDRQNNRQFYYYIINKLDAYKGSHNNSFFPIYLSLWTKFDVLDFAILGAIHQQCIWENNFHKIGKDRVAVFTIENFANKFFEPSLSRTIKRKISNLVSLEYLKEGFFGGNYDKKRWLRLNYSHLDLSAFYSLMNKNVSETLCNSTLCQNDQAKFDLGDQIGTTRCSNWHPIYKDNNNFNINNPVVPLAGDFRKQPNEDMNLGAEHTLSFGKRNTASTNPVKDRIGIEDERIAEMMNLIWPQYGMHVSRLPKQMDSFRRKYVREALTLRRWESLVKTWGENLFEELKLAAPEQCFQFANDTQRKGMVNYWIPEHPDSHYCLVKIPAWGGIENCLAKGFPKFEQGIDDKNVTEGLSK